MSEGETWQYSNPDDSVIDQIQTQGWQPQASSSCKFGCGVYLARGLWYPDTKRVIRCRVHLADHEVMRVFPLVPGFEQHGAGRTERHFERYLKDEGVVPGRPKVEKGSSAQNTAITSFFLDQGIRAVEFIEHTDEVIVVYDTDAIEILSVESVQA